MNQPSRSDESIRYHSIGFSARGMVEYSGKERLAFIPAAEIWGIEVGEGFTAERQGLQLLLGLAGVTLGPWTRAMLTIRRVRTFARTFASIEKWTNISPNARVLRSRIRTVALRIREAGMHDRRDNAV